MSKDKDSDYLTIFLQIRASQEKFDYAFTSLCFASFVLSLNFSPREEATYTIILVSAWGLYLVSALLGGWRLMTSPQVDKINLAKNRIDRFIKDTRASFLNPEVVDAFKDNRVLNSESGKRLTLDQLSQGLKNEEAKLEMATKNLKALDKKMVPAFKAQVVCYCLALVLNVTYLSINLWSHT